MSTSRFSHRLSSSSVSSWRSSSPPSAPRFRPRLPSPAPGGAASIHAPRWDRPVPRACFFCSTPGHLIRECPIASQYLRQGKITRNSLGRFTLPNGRYPSHQVPGRNLQERIDYFQANFSTRAQASEDHEVIASNFLGVVSDVSSASHQQSSSPSHENNSDMRKLIESMQEQLGSLQEEILVMKERFAKSQPHAILTRKPPSMSPSPQHPPPIPYSTCPPPPPQLQPSTNPLPATPPV